MSENVEDGLGFGHDDKVVQASVLRPYRGGRYIAAIFVLKRSTGLFDLFISGAGPLHEKTGLSDSQASFLMEEFKGSSLEMPEGAIWEDVELLSNASMDKHLEALIAAGIPLRYEVSEQ